MCLLDARLITITGVLVCLLDARLRTRASQVTGVMVANGSNDAVKAIGGDNQVFGVQGHGAELYG